MARLDPVAKAPGLRGGRPVHGATRGPSVSGITTAARSGIRGAAIEAYTGAALRAGVRVHGFGRIWVASWRKIITVITRGRAAVGSRPVQTRNIGEYLTGAGKACGIVSPAARRPGCGRAGRGRVRPGYRVLDTRPTGRDEYGDEEEVLENLDRFVGHENIVSRNANSGTLYMKSFGPNLGSCHGLSTIRGG